ncbi:MAG TPA: hypothetical protein VGO46_13520 [Gemmatimonadaceae bacterium]|nr:hypothetical protein [Gemmatimonadaceae bacterium]
MKRIAIMAAALMAVAACNKTDKSATTDTTTVGGAVAPASDSTGAMNNTGTMGGSSMGADSSKMSGGASSGAMSTDTSANKSGVQNQSQSGVTDSSGSSTLGPNVTKTSPTHGAPVTAKGDTLKKKTP